jgi:TrmH RNA methyltransferase
MSERPIQRGRPKQAKSEETESPWSRAHSERSGRDPHPNPSPIEGEAPEHRTPEGGGASASREMRLYGLNACLAAFAKRPEALRKVYLVEARIPVLKPVLAWCVKHRLGYRVVENADLEKLTASSHHEGVCFEMLRAVPLDLTQLLAAQPNAPAPSLLLWLDGVGNPHNLGALLRSAAHFGAAGAIVPQRSALDISGAAARVAEGAAEIVPLVRAPADAQARDALRAAGYSLAATVPRNGVNLYGCDLPARLVVIFGAEQEGMSDSLIAAADLRLMIPGSGAVESLNVAASAAVLLGEYWRQHAGDARQRVSATPAAPSPRTSPWEARAPRETSHSDAKSPAQRPRPKSHR